MPARKGTEPGTDEAERRPMRPIIAARPLRISTLRPRAFFSGDIFSTLPRTSPFSPVTA